MIYVMYINSNPKKDAHAARNRPPDPTDRPTGTERPPAPTDPHMRDKP